ncbi:MAG: hypothetical protein WBL20_07745 [Sphingobium sp.]|uniref:hypothetical protein n=1 Tax=Sphingobium sp. TaxID=1912891 RepID=UPI003BB0D35B
MSRVSPIQTNFNGGELSPYMLGRIDHEVYGISTAAMVGWVPRPQGGMEACPGFEYIGTAPGPCRLIPFEPYVSQGHVIEASANLFRFYTNDVLLRDGDGDPVTVATPWTFAQLGKLNTAQSNDVVYLFHPDFQQRRLVRTAADAFTLELLELENGPFGDRNNDEDSIVTFSGVTGAVTITATKPIFAAGDVGGLFEVEAGDLGRVPSWEPGISVAMGDLLQWNGRVYQVVGVGAGSKTGTVQPFHSRGVEWDGIGKGTDINDKTAGGVQLAYLHDMYGRLKITGYTSPTQVSATVTRRLPLTVAESVDYSGYSYGGTYIPRVFNPGSYHYVPGDSGDYPNGTWRWRFGAFSQRRGWPEGGVIFDQRLYLWKGDTIYASVAGALHDFDRLDENGDLQSDSAFTGTIDNPNPIRWMLAGAELFVGTAIAEHVLRPASQAKGIGYDNVKLTAQSNAGSAPTRPIEKDGRPIFLQRNGRKLLMMFEERVEKYATEDLTRYADHIGNSPFVEFCWQREPLQLIWAVREDGTLACADSMPTEQVLGWCRRPLGGGLLARSICSITAPDGRRDQLWCAAQKGGAYWIMALAPFRQAGESDATAIMADAALRYSGDPVTQVGAPHLAGLEVDVVADGAWLGRLTADDEGWIALGRAAESVMAGLAFPAYVDLLPIEAGGDNGPAQGKMKRNGRIMVRVHDALGLRLSVQGVALRDLENQMGNSPMDDALPLVTADIINDMVGTWDRAGQVRLERVAPKQCTVLAIGITSEVAQR